MKPKLLNGAVLLLCISSASGIARAQSDACKEKADFNTWFACRVEEAVKVRITQRNSTKQSEAPSVSSNSTTLLDTSSASDLAGIALNLAGLSSGSSDQSNQKATSTSATVSAYAFKAAASRRDPLDPTFYNSNRDYRRLFFTLGYDYPEGQQSNPNQRGIIYGIKYLPYDKRDASDPSNKQRVDTISAASGKFGGAFSRAAKRAEDYLYTVAVQEGKIPSSTTINDFSINQVIAPAWLGKIYPMIGEAELKTIDGFITNEIDAFVGLKDVAMKAAEEVRKAPQISLAFFGTERKQNNPNDYKVEAIVDLGFKRGNFTMNLAYQFRDNKVIKNNQGGTVAIGSQVLLTRDELEGRMPWIFSVAINGSWMTNMTPMYQGQAKLTIPLFQGVDIPLSVTVASRKDLINEKEVKGHVGFTFDLSRIAQAFKGKLQSGG